MVVIMSQPAQPPSCAGLTAPPERMKAVDSHRHRLEPFFNVVPLSVVELTAQLIPKEGNQVPTTINQKLRV